MRTSHKVTIDQWVGLPLIYGFNLLARLAGWVLRPNHAIPPDQVRTVVVAKFLGLGSIVESTPMLRNLRRRFPQARLIFLTAQANAPLLARLGIVDEGLYVDDGSLLRLGTSTCRAVVRLMRSRPQWYFDLEVYSAYAGLLALFSLARNRAGFYRRSAGFKQGLYTHLMYFNSRRSIRLIYGQLAAMAGADRADLETLGPLRISSEDQTGLDHLLRSQSWAGRPYVVVNPNASDLVLERRWPREGFAAVTQQLVELGWPVVMIGTVSEQPHVAELLEQIPPEARSRVWDTAGRLSFGELLALLRGAAAVLTNDTGPMHLAIALSRPTVCLFGPVSPRHYGFVRPNVIQLSHPVYCSPCVHETAHPPCHGDNQCMKLIPAGEVLTAMRRLLDAPTSPAMRLSDPRGSPSSPPATRSTERVESRQGSEFAIPSRPITLTTPTGEPLGMVLSASVRVPAGRPCPVCAATRWREVSFRLGFPLLRCAKCGLEILHPQPPDAVLAQIYGQEYYKAWGLEKEEAAVREQKLATFALRLRLLGPLPQGTRILDCGAATGYLMEAARTQGLEAYGVELSDFGSAEIARKFGRDHVFAGPFEDAAFPGLAEGAFAAIFMCDFLEHARDPFQVLNKAHGLLQKDGRLVLATPDAGSLSRRLMGASWLHYKTEHLYYFNRRNLKHSLEAAGFEVLTTTSAWKVMTLHYAASQVRTYPHWLLSPALRLLEQVIPLRLRLAMFRVAFGEMAIVARKAP